MKRSLVLVFTLFLTHMSYSQGIIFFDGTWQEALDKAKTEDKLIFVDAYTKWCGPCKRMSKNVFTQKKAGDFYNSKFINVKMDMENGKNAEFVGKYPVRAYPTLLFIGGDGKIALKSVGGKKINDLIKLGKKALLSNNKSDDYAKEYEKGERSFSFIIKYIKELNLAGKSSLKIANDYIKSNPKLSDKQMNELIYESMTEIDSKFYDLFISHKKELISEYGEKGFHKKILSACNRTLKKSIEFDFIELTELAIDALKNHHTSEVAKDFEINAYKSFYLEQGNQQEYTKSVKSYYKAIAKNDVTKIIPLVKEISQAYPKDKKLQKIIDKCFDQLIKLDAPVNDLLFGSQYYYRYEKSDRAIKLAEVALAKAKKDKKSTRIIEKYLKIYKNS